ncbi:MAG TPA: hypothetical protein DCQ31_10220 [Bacteroidales bacterium]|nr:hypothetical protein [Bacteroidales bacterium]
MSIRIKSLLIVPALVGLILFTGGCKNEPKTDNDELNSLIQPDAESSPVIKINNRLFSVPSPVQISQLVKSVNQPFNSDMLNPAEKVSNYTETMKRALNLGAYGADLSYLNIYERLPEAAAYFAVVKQLSDELGITATFDKETMKRIENNNSNKDSLLRIFSTIYRDADAFLMNNERNEVAVLILTGGWIESLYFLTQMVTTNKNQDIINRIGEQKYPLDNLNSIITPYYGNYSEEFDALIEQMVELAYVFDGVQIDYTYEPPTIDVANKITVINSTSKTTISDYQLKKISELTQILRNKIVN